MAAPRRPPRLAAAAARAAALPAYTLYGDAAAAPLPEALHVETVAHRSRSHGWEIRDHRHAALYQLLVIRSGEVLARLDGRVVAVSGPCAITVPALAAHGFRFSPDIDGTVFTIAEPHVAALAAAVPGWSAALLQLRAVAAVGAAVLDAAAALRDDYARHDRWRTPAVDAGLRRLLVELARALPADAAADDGAPPRPLRHVQAYRALVDAQYRRQPTLGELAAQIGITPTQLNRCCRRVLGRSALAVLHARLLLEAQRELRYTALSVKEVALGLGFADAGYFTRFFRRGTGCTPSAWRAAA